MLAESQNKIAVSVSRGDDRGLYSNYYCYKKGLPLAAVSSKCLMQGGMYMGKRVQL